MVEITKRLQMLPLFSRRRPRQNLPSLIRVALCCFLLSISAGAESKASPHVASTWTGEQVMSPDETEAVYEVLEAVNKDIAWRQQYSAAGAGAEANLCLEGPHGLVCGADERNVLHVVELNLGWLSDATNNPPCGPNASFSPALTRFPYLRKLFFYNCFSDPLTPVMLPSFLWALGSSLEELVFLRNTMLVGGLPEDIAKLVNLKRLILVGNNALQGSLPEELGELTMLEQLVLSRNKHTGVVPERLGSLRKLRVLDVSWNLLEGNIPAALASAMGALQKLDMSHNELSGCIPASVGKASSLELLDLSWNKLWGPLPDGSWGGMRYLRVLEMGHNAFNGSALPMVMWASMRRLIGVGMAEAGLRGLLPEAMGQLRSLRYLDLSGNELEGEVPASLELGLPSIFEMNLSGNRLRGVLPFSVEFVARMGKNLRVGDNEGLCSSLQHLKNSDVNHFSSSSSLTRSSGALGASLQLPACVHGLVQQRHDEHQLSPARHAAAALIYITSRSSSSLISPLLHITISYVISLLLIHY